MAYSNEVLRRAQERLAQKKADHESKMNQRLWEAYNKVPRLREIDMQLRRTMTVAAQTAFMKGGDPVAIMEQVKQANLSLQAERKALAEENFAPSYFEDTLCQSCGGSGFVGSSMCDCLRQLCREEQKKEIAKLTCGVEQFSNFRLDYYPQKVDAALGVSPRQVMEKVFAYSKKYAENFTPGMNMLFVGGTGLGKTFLSACVANTVADKGYSVAYESAPQLFEKLNKNQFNPDEESARQVQALKNCDLLIIDDLGTELTNNFVISALYSLVNDRLITGKSMLISTNLNVSEIAQRYNPQIASRLQGNFKNLVFLGEDIRVLKNRGI